MKIWQAILLAVLLVTMPVLSSCDLLGIGNSRQRQQADYYKRQLEAIQKVQEANRQQQEAYNKQLQQGLNEWSEVYSEWQQQQQQQQLGQVEGMPTNNQS